MKKMHKRATATGVEDLDYVHIYFSTRSQYFDRMLKEVVEIQRHEGGSRRLKAVEYISSYTHGTLLKELGEGFLMRPHIDDSTTRKVPRHSSPYYR